MAGQTNETIAVPRGWRLRIRDNEQLPRSFVWVARAFGFLWVGLLTLIAQWHSRDTRTISVQVGGYAVIGVAAGVWAGLDARRPERTPPGGWILFALGTVSVVSGAICMSHNAGLLALMACIAALVAGSDSTLAAAVAIACCGILGVMAGGVLFGANAPELIGYPITILSALLMGRHRHTYRAQAEQAAALLDRTRELQVQQRRADVLDERARIAREIHDVLAHSLGALGIQIQAARAVLTDGGDIDRALDVLTTAQRMASDGLAETRRAVFALRADALALDQELQKYAAIHGGRYGTEVAVSIDGEPRDLPPAAAMALIRVASEALVNAAKHADHQPIELILEYGADRVRVTVDNPVAPSATATDAQLHTLDGGYGLTGMRERLLLIGGTLDAGRCGERWTVTAQLPYARASTED